MAAQLYQCFRFPATATAAATETSKTWAFTLPEDSGAGNCYIFALAYPTGVAVPTISDNNGNTWTGTNQVTVTGTSNNLTIWALPNVNAGTTRITVTFAAAEQPVWGELQEWSGIATSSPTAATISTASELGASLTTGSFTPGAGNLVLAFFYADDNNIAGPTGWVAGTSFTLMYGDSFHNGGDSQGQPSASEYLTSAASGAINPGMTATADTTGHYNCAAIALTSSSGAGTPPSTSKIRIVKTIKFGSNTTATAASLKVNFPTLGNLRVYFSVTRVEANITSIVDTDSTYTNLTQSVDSPPVFYAKNQSADATNVVTFNLPVGGNNTPFDAIMYDIANAATGTVVGAVGHTVATSVNAASAPHMPDITPQATNSLITAAMSVGNGPTTGVTSPSAARMINIRMDSAAFTATISGTVMTVSAVSSGTIVPNMTVGGNGVTTGTAIISNGTGTGGTGTYNLNTSSTVSSATSMTGDTENDTGTINFGGGVGLLHNTSVSAQNWTWTVCFVSTTDAAVAIEWLPAPVTPSAGGGRSALTTQEYPDLGSGKTWPGVPPNVAAPLQGRIVETVQEFPDLGYARTWAGVPPNVAAPPQIAHIITVQEYPDHPQPPLFQRFQIAAIITPVPPVNTRAYTTQEIPDHPQPTTLGAPGVFGNGPAPTPTLLLRTLMGIGI